MPQTQAQRDYNARRTLANQKIREAAVAANLVAAAIETAPPTYSEKVLERGQATSLRREVKDLTERNQLLEEQLSRLVAIDPVDLVVPAWLKPRPTGKTHHATPVLMLSDLHLDEVVDEDEMDGMNSYDRSIAERRLDRVIDFTAEFCKRYVGNLHYDGVVVALLGDILTGIIHAELAQTNDALPTESIVHWVPRLASGLRYLADEFGAVHVPTVDGNHDRTTHRIQAKQRTTSSYAWVLYNWLSDAVHDDRITFSITKSPEQVIDIQGTRFLLTHGDGFRSAGGVGGIYPSMLKFLHRKHELYARTGKPWDVALMGHWHQLLFGPDFVVNGSLKGYDEYAKSNGFGFEKPRQALFIVTPERGITTQTAVYADAA